MHLVARRSDHDMHDKGNVIIDTFMNDSRVSNLIVIDTLAHVNVVYHTCLLSNDFVVLGLPQTA